MKPCPHCSKDVRDTDIACVHCGRLLDEPTGGVAATIAAPPARVVVANIDMPFMEIVMLLVKWSLAAVPAALILGALGAFVLGMLAALGNVSAGLP